MVSTASAQTYPNGTVSIVIPLAAGTGMDTLVRIYANQLQIALKGPVIVKNEPGASFMIAPTTVAKSPPDGLTLLATVSSTLVINQTLFKSMPYDPVRAFVPISYYVKSPFVLVVGSNSEIRTANEFVAVARSRNLTYASLGPGTSQNLTMELLKQRYGLKMTEVPYRATPQQITDIASGNVDVGFVEAAASQGLIQDGKLRALAVSSAQRFKLYPDVPTVAEALNAPDFEAVSWHMLLAPSATPRPIVDRLHEEMMHITASPEFVTKASALGLIPIASPSPEEITGFLAAESKKWGNVLTQIGLAGSQ
jgi:tripartite-type tricarboxylate transporter receptor subunit TctC